MGNILILKNRKDWKKPEEEKPLLQINKEIKNYYASLETKKSRKEWILKYKAFKEKDNQSKILCLVKLFSKSKGEITTFSWKKLENSSPAKEECYLTLCENLHVLEDI